jgi:2-polyprenyl-3-methyl-5-hydroxy-6-metoxy-1,4-benzoquinol methylase
MNLLENIHGKYIFERRVRVLSDHLARLMPKEARVLDVGCGNGLIAKLVMQQRPDIKIQGIDVLVRGETYIPVTSFDGKSIPYDNGSFDVVMFVDVLHHTEDPTVLLSEALRTAKKSVILKDHTCNGFLAHQTLSFMDNIGNQRHGVALPYNYWPKQKWLAYFQAYNIKVAFWNKHLNLYPFPVNLFFERSLHFMACLESKVHLT